MRAVGAAIVLNRMAALGVETVRRNELRWFRIQSLAGFAPWRS